jgi:hypothetical protein
MNWRNDFRIKRCMRFTYLVGVLSVVIVASSVPAVAVEEPSSTLVVTTLEDSIELSVPASRLTLTFPRGGLATVNDPRAGAGSEFKVFSLQ